MSEIENIWLERWNQNIEGALRGLAAIQNQKAWEKLDTPLLAQVREEDQHELVEALLLKASLLRAQGRQADSSQLINRIYRSYTKAARALPFRLAFEVGLDFWLREDYSQSLEFFLLAEQKATSPIQKLFCYSNMLWNLEALDLEREKIEKNLEAQLRLMLQSSHGPAVKNVRDQYQAYDLRKKFYGGNLDLREVDAALSHSAVLTQSSFFQMLIKRLPYFTGERIQNLDQDLELFSAGRLWQGSYRLRTLSGVLVPSDGHLFRCGDAIDRLYLWTWLYMAGVPEISLEKIEVTLASIIGQIELDRLSVENRLLLRNAVKWLQLIAPRTVISFKPLLERRYEASPRYSVLEAEFSRIDLARKNKVLLQRTDWPYHFSLPEKNLPRLSRVLNEMEQIQNMQKGSVHIVVDQHRQEIQSFQNGELVRSEGLTDLFSRLAKGSRIPIVDLPQAYAQDRRKLYNLISRAKPLLPFSSLKIMGDFIFLENADELKIHLNSGESTLSRADKAAPITRGGRAGAREKIVTKEAARVVFADGFDRTQIEKSFKVSKAKACRVIAEWLLDGSVAKAGNGKSVSYVWRKL